jgi:hypothetical protein
LSITVVLREVQRYKDRFSVFLLPWLTFSVFFSVSPPEFWRYTFQQTAIACVANFLFLTNHAFLPVSFPFIWKALEPLWLKQRNVFFSSPPVFLYGVDEETLCFRQHIMSSARERRRSSFSVPTCMVCPDAPPVSTCCCSLIFPASRSLSVLR